MDLAYLIYLLANDEALVGQLQAAPEETLDSLGLRLDPDALSALLATLPHRTCHQDLSGREPGPGPEGIDWAGGSLPGQSLTA